MNHEYNPCDHLIDCELSSEMKTAAGLAWLYTEYKFWSIYIGFPRAIPVELKGIAT